MSRDPLSVVREFLARPEADFRRNAVTALAVLENSDARRDLIQVALGDRDEGVRAAALEELAAAKGDPSDSEEFARALVQHPSFEARSRVLQICAKRDDRGAALGRGLKAILREDGAPARRAYALLGQMRDMGLTTESAARTTFHDLNRRPQLFGVFRTTFLEYPRRVGMAVSIRGLPDTDHEAPFDWRPLWPAISGASIGLLAIHLLLLSYGLLDSERYLPVLTLVIPLVIVAAAVLGVGIAQRRTPIRLHYDRAAGLLAEFLVVVGRATPWALLIGLLIAFFFVGQLASLTWKQGLAWGVGFFGLCVASVVGVRLGVILSSGVLAHRVLGRLCQVAGGGAAGGTVLLLLEAVWKRLGGGDEAGIWSILAWLVFLPVLVGVAAAEGFSARAEVRVFDPKLVLRARLASGVLVLSFVLAAGASLPEAFPLDWPGKNLRAPGGAVVRTEVPFDQLPFALPFRVDFLQNVRVEASTSLSESSFPMARTDLVLRIVGGLGNELAVVDDAVDEGESFTGRLGPGRYEAVVSEYSGFDPWQAGPERSERKSILVRAGDFFADLWRSEEALGMGVVRLVLNDGRRRPHLLAPTDSGTVSMGEFSAGEWNLGATPATRRLVVSGEGEQLLQARILAPSGLDEHGSGEEDGPEKTLEDLRVQLVRSGSEEVLAEATETSFWLEARVTAGEYGLRVVDGLDEGPEEGAEQHEGKDPDQGTGEHDAEGKPDATARLAPGTILLFAANGDDGNTVAFDSQPPEAFDRAQSTVGTWSVRRLPVPAFRFDVGFEQTVRVRVIRTDVTDLRVSLRRVGGSEWRRFSQQRLGEGEYEVRLEAASVGDFVVPAEIELEFCLNCRPAEAVAAYLEGLLGEDRFEETLQWFESAAATNPELEDSQPLHRLLCWQLSLGGRPDLVDSSCDRLRELSGEASRRVRVGALVILATHQAQAGDLEEALSTLSSIDSAGLRLPVAQWVGLLETDVNPFSDPVVAGSLRKRSDAGTDRTALVWGTYADHGEEHAHTVAALERNLTDWQLADSTDSSVEELEGLLDRVSVLVVSEVEMVRDDAVMGELGEAVARYLACDGSVVLLAPHTLVLDTLREAGLVDLVPVGSRYAGREIAVPVESPLAIGESLRIPAPNRTQSYLVRSSEAETWAFYGDDPDDAIVVSRRVGGRLVVVGMDYFDESPEADLLLANAVRSALYD